MSEKERTVLVAEDDDNDFWFFESAFKQRRAGLALQRARDGAEAIEYLAGEGAFTDRSRFPVPDLFVLDLAMPRRNGFEVLGWLRKRPQFEVLPVVVLSSSEGKEDMQRALSLGANSYIVKPRQHDRYAALVGLIQEYWLEWNRGGDGQET